MEKQQPVNFIRTYKHFLLDVGLDIYDVQQAAQLDITQNKIDAENLFYFAYVLEKETDRKELFEKYLIILADEFHLPRNEGELTCNDVIDYVEFKIDQVKDEADELIIFNAIHSLEYWLFGVKAAASRCSDLFDKSYDPNCNMDQFSKILNKIYCDPILVSQFITVFYNIRYDNYADDNDLQQLYVTLKNIIKQLNSNRRSVS